MGSATLCQLALRGRRVLGIEQYNQGHSLGSSHGDSRIIRETYFEHPLYVPLVQRAHALWRELEGRTGNSLMTITGGLMIGPPDGMVVTGTRRSAIEHDLPHEVLDAAALRGRYPAFRPTKDMLAVWDPQAGVLDPDACNAAHIDVARAAGAEVRWGERVIGWKADGDGVRVNTTANSYLTNGLVVAAGGWSSDLLPDMNLPLTVERQAVFWLDPAEPRFSYALGQFPIYAYEYQPGEVCYGFPRLTKGVKASVMHAGEIAGHPSAVRRDVGAADIEQLRAALRPILPELAESAVRATDTCMFTNTPDHDFIVDFYPGYPQVLVSSACSGHGFKFASVIGEIQADLLIEGRAQFDLSPFSIGRFGENDRAD